jgi:hypothetical protein
MMPLGFSDEQVDRLMDAAAMLPASRRDVFLRSVAGRLAGLPDVGDAEFEQAINFVLNNYGVALGCNAITPNKYSQLAKGVFR